MKIAIAQTDSVPFDIEANVRRHLLVIEEAIDRGADLAVFPELSLTGYDVRERAAELALRPQSAALRPLFEASTSIDVHFSFIELASDFRIFNSCAYAAAGELRHIHRKTYLPTYGRFDEGKYFAAGDSVRAFDLWADESRMAKATGLGRLRAGAIICEDLWHPSVAWLLAQDGAQILIVQAGASQTNVCAPAVPEAALQRWESLAISAALSSGAFLVLANKVGKESDYNYFGSSFVVDPRGQIISRASLWEPELLITEVDFDEVRSVRTDMPLLRDERLDLDARELSRIVKMRFEDDG